MVTRHPEAQNAGAVPKNCPVDVHTVHMPQLHLLSPLLAVI
jgi:hypothetical protein